MFIIFACLLTITQQGFNITFQSKCNKDKPIFANFAVAGYGPPLTEMSLQLYLVSSLDMCEPVTDYSTIAYFENKTTQKSILVPRGNCPFAIKTLNAQTIGVDLLIVYPNFTDPTLVAMQSSPTSSPINISSIFISSQTVLQLTAIFTSRCGPIEINIFDTSVKIQLPSVFFDINDQREMEYLSEFYRHQFFDAFISKMVIEHKIVYTNNDCSERGCDREKDCLLLTPVNSDNYLCYTAKDYQHSGKRVMKEQFRSLAIFQTLGQAKWFQYRELFYHNLCHFNEQIENCFNKTLSELEVPTKIIKQIKTRMEDYQRPQSIYEHKDSLVRIFIKYQQAYTSQIPSIYSQLCAKLSLILQECRILRGVSQKISISNNEAILQDLQMKSQRSFFIEISKPILDKLDELVFVLTDLPHAFNSLEYIDLYAEIPNTVPNFEIKCLFDANSNMAQNSINLVSKTDAQNQKYIILKKKDIVSNKLTIMLSLIEITHYKLMIRAKPVNQILIPNQDLISIYQGLNPFRTTVEFVFSESEPNFQFVLALKANSLSQYVVYFTHYGSNQKSNLEGGRISQNFLFLYVSKKAALGFTKNQKNCQRKINDQKKYVYTCKLILSLNKQTKTGELVHLSLQKFNKSQEIRPLNSVIETPFVHNVLTVQKITLNRRDLPFKLNQFKMEVQTNHSSLFRHQYRILKQDSKEFTSLSEWRQEYQQKTEPLYHEDRFGSNNSCVSLMEMRHHYNSLKQYLKIRNITIFLIYRPITDQFVETFLIKQSIKLTSSKVEEQWLSANSYQQSLGGVLFMLKCNYSQSPTFNRISGTSSNTLMQLRQKDENIRIFVQMHSEAVLTYKTQHLEFAKQLRSPKVYNFLKPKYENAFTHFASNYNDTHKHKHSEYLEYIENPFLSMIKISANISEQKKKIEQNKQLRLYTSEYQTHIQIFVEMIHKTTILGKNPIYLVGNTLQKSQRDETKTLQSAKSSLTNVNLFSASVNYFIVESTKSIRILTLEALFPQFTSMLRVCTYQTGFLEQSNIRLIECSNYTKDSVKYWRNLNNSQIVEGVKLKQSAMQIRIDLPIANQSDLNITQFIGKEKSSLDIYVKIKFRDFDKMIEASEQTGNVNKTEEDIGFIDNSQEIIKDYSEQQLKGSQTEESIKQDKDVNETQEQKTKEEGKQKEREKQEKEKEEAAQKEKQKQEKELFMATFLNKTHSIISQQLSKHLQEEKSFKSISPVNPDSLVQKSDQIQQQLASPSSQTYTIFLIIMIILAIVATVLLFNTFVLLKLLRNQQKKQPVRTSNSLSEQQSSQKITKNQSNIMS